MMYRLAEINSEESARILVELWANENAGWDGGAALGAADAIVRCGVKAIPYLERRPESHQQKRLLHLIRSGTETAL